MIRPVSRVFTDTKTIYNGDGGCPSVRSAQTSSSGPVALASFPNIEYAATRTSSDSWALWVPPRAFAGHFPATNAQHGKQAKTIKELGINQRFVPDR